MERRRALLIFCRVPRAGTVKSRLAASVGVQLALDFYRACVKHIMSELVRKQSIKGVRCFVFWTSRAPSAGADEVVQSDALDMKQWMEELGLADLVQLERQDPSHDLGVKMERAFSAVLEQGFGEAVLVGTDIPDLSSKEIDSAFSALQLHQVVFGPAADGGYYLLAVKGPQVPGCIFKEIPWSTSRVLQRSVEAADASGVLVAPDNTLPKLRDIDTLDDLVAWHGSKVERGECQQLKQNNIASTSPQELCGIAISLLEERLLIEEAIAATGYTL